MLNFPSTSEVAESVRQFNARYDEMERALWRLSNAARLDLLRRRASSVVEGLVWTVRSWWGVQGAPVEIKSLMAKALATQEWTQKFFEEGIEPMPVAERFAIDRVSGLVSSTLNFGSKREEFSLASKVLHWLMPWRIPVYDSFVRKAAGVPSTWIPLDAYRRIVQWQFDAARPLVSEGLSWIGDVEPISPFRALDKYMWWIGGGSVGRAVVARDPWRVVRQLGLSP